MNDRLLNTLLRSVSVKGQLSPEKAKALSSEARDSVMKHLIRRRKPVAKCLMPDTFDESWLNAMGYMYHSTSPTTGLAFRHTCEHIIK